MDVHHQIRLFWDRDAETYDDSPGHAVADPAEAEAWRAALRAVLPPAPARVLDAGAGTGAMSLLAAQLGYTVTALDLSPRMLERARRKAEDLGLALEVVEGTADRPPPGPFDAVIERHLIWTVPDPVATLEAWREVAPRAVLFEGLWGGAGPAHRLRRKAVVALRTAYGIPDDHHAEYPEDVRARLPLGRGLTPDALLDAARRAGWRRYRLDRQRDVERARRASAPWPLGALETVPRFVLVLER